MPVIPDVPAFAAEPDAGNLALLAAQAALSAVGLQCSLVRLACVSGDAFKLFYDTAPVREPLRDLRPVDTLARAFAACGLRAEWVPDATLDHVRGQVEAQAAIGQPVLTSGLPGTGDVFSLLVGYDEDSDTLSYRSAAARSAQAADYAGLGLADGLRWDGPITGPPHRLDFPMLVIRGPLYNPPDDQTQRRDALETALAILEGAPVAYPDHPGAQQRAAIKLAGRKAAQGWVALEYLVRDLAEADLSSMDTRWRLHAQLAQLAWDRDLAVHYFESWGGAASGALVAAYRTIAHLARTLLSRNGERRSRTLYSQDELTRFVEGTAAYLYLLPDDPKVLADVAGWGLGQRVESRQGPALLVDSPERRQSAIKLAGRLLDAERSCGSLLKQALSAV